MPAKLTRKQIKEGLDSVSIDTLILGTQSKETKLTSKQRAFAREIAMGETKAGAYRKAYNSKGKAKTQGDEGYRLAKSPAITAEIEAIRLANEAQKYQTPRELRALVIHQLTQHALDPEIPPAQRIKALQLLGTVSEVAAFTERKEVLNVTQSADIKAQLLSRLQALTGAKNNLMTIDSDPLQVEDDLLLEIKEAKLDQADPTRPPPPEMAAAELVGSRHTIPHKQSAIESDDLLQCNTQE
jgi:hypothetical protein